MNAPTKTLTEAEYRTRRGSLERQLAAADAANAAAELKASNDEIDDDELAQSRAAVETVKAKLRGLAAARSESERLETLRACDEQVRARRRASAKLKKLIEERERIFGAALEALTAAAPGFRRYEEITDQIVRLAGVHQAGIDGPFGFPSLIHTLKERFLEAQIVLGTLYNMGLGDWGIGDRNSGPDSQPGGRLRQRQAGDVRAMLGAVATLCGEAGDGED